MKVSEGRAKAVADDVPYAELVEPPLAELVSPLERYVHSNRLTRVSDWNTLYRAKTELIVKLGDQAEGFFVGLLELSEKIDKSFPKPKKGERIDRTLSIEINFDKIPHFYNSCLICSKVNIDPVDALEVIFSVATICAVMSLETNQMFILDDSVLTVFNIISGEELIEEAKRDLQSVRQQRSKDAKLPDTQRDEVLSINKNPYATPFR